MRWLFDSLVNFCFIYFLLNVEELSYCFSFFSFNRNFDFFLSVMTNIKTKCGIIYKKKKKKIPMRACDDERMIMSGLMM